MFPENVANTPLLGLGMTIILYTLCETFVARFKLKLVPPILIACPLIVVALLYFPSISYKQYAAGANFLSFLLGPATIALGLPLYRNRRLVKENAALILSSILFGTVLSLVWIYALGKITGLSEQVLLSLLPKSVTTPIAIEITKVLGGLPPITTAVVIFSGIFGAALNHKLLKLFRVHNDLACGLAIGLSSHGLGTSACVGVSNVQLAISGCAMGLTGIATSILAPILLPILKALW